MITPYFFLRIENPFIGYLSKAFILLTGAYYPNDIDGTSHSNIFPSVPKESML